MGATTSESDLATVQKFMQLIAEEKFDEARPLMHDDFWVDEAGGLPYSGIYEGADGFFDLARTITGQFTLTANEVNILPIGDTYVCRFVLTFTRKDNGKSHTMKFVEIYEVRDGKLAGLDVFYKDPLAITKLAEGA
jgi:hypothetical protein